MALTPSLHPLHKAIKRLLLLVRAVGPPVRKLQLALLIAIAGAKEVFELLPAHRVGEALHIEPDVSCIGGWEHGQSFALLRLRPHLESRAIVIP